MKGRKGIYRKLEVKEIKVKREKEKREKKATKNIELSRSYSIYRRQNKLHKLKKGTVICRHRHGLHRQWRFGWWWWFFVYLVKS